MTVPKYHGRGDLQITGRTAYTLASNALGIDLVNNPSLAATDPVVAALVSAWYWGWKTAYMYNPATGKLRTKDPVTGDSLITGYINKKPIYKKFTLGQLADRGDIYSISHNINAATLAINQRLADTARAMSILVPKK